MVPGGYEPVEDTIMSDEVAARLEALEIETAAYSAIFTALAQLLGPAFLDGAAMLVQLTGAHPQAPGPVQKRMTEALRIIDDLRKGSDRKPKPGNVV